MHTLTLVTVDIEDTTQINVEATALKRLLEAIQTDAPISDRDSFVTELLLQRANSRRDVFSSMVDDAIAEKLEPYCECTEDMRYLEFVDKTEDVTSAYENGCSDFIRLPEGRYVPATWHGKFCIKDGKVYQRKAGPLHHEMRTKKAKKMTAFENLPFKKVYKTLADFATHFYGICYHEDRKAYGYYTNPNSFWDWYSIGGRWPAQFLVKESCKEYTIGERGRSEEMPECPEGYVWAVGARKKDIEWQVQFEFAKNRLTERFYELERIFQTGTLPEGMFGMINEHGIGFLGDMYYVAGETLDENLKRHGYPDDLKYHAGGGAFVDLDSAYVDRFDVLSPGDDRDGWYRIVDDFIDRVDDNTVIVGVDCHV